MISAVLPDGALAETIANEEGTKFLVWRNDHVEECAEVVINGEVFVPLAASNKLLRHGVLILASGASPYGSTEQLVDELRTFFRQYVDLSPDFELVAAYYALLTWVHDAFSEVPYLRFHGDYGTGKSRALLVLGAVCYKAVFASGASSISPIFHILESYRGTLIFDETDFRYSDERADIVKILNNGNIKGFPVLRTMISAKREFEPQAFSVFGPKIVAMRDAFEDEALESRFITEEMGKRPLRSDIPINLGAEYKDAALLLRNKLLMYRLNTRDTVSITDDADIDDLSARVQQIVRPLLSLIEQADHRSAVLRVIHLCGDSIQYQKRNRIEAKLLAALHAEFTERRSETVTLSMVRQRLLASGEEFRRPITHRYVGSLLRKMGIPTFKTRGIAVIAASEKERVEELLAGFGVDSSQSRDKGIAHAKFS